MAEPHPPFQPTDPAAEQKRHHAKRQLVLCYKRVFSTDSGKKVLADLRHLFGMDRWECENESDAQAIARRCAAKGPIFHIEKQLKTEFRQGKPTRPTP
jgi:hypothetical protein